MARGVAGNSAKLMPDVLLRCPSPVSSASLNAATASAMSASRSNSLRGPPALPHSSVHSSWAAATS